MPTVLTLLLILPTMSASAQAQTAQGEIIYPEDGGYIPVEITYGQSMVRATVSNRKQKQI
jgi:hypothetical protein